MIIYFKNSSQETTSKINIKNLFNLIESELNNNNLKIIIKDNVELKGRPNALKRSFENIIQNGLTMELIVVDINGVQTEP